MAAALAGDAEAMQQLGGFANLDIQLAEEAVGKPVGEWDVKVEEENGDEEEG